MHSSFQNVNMGFDLMDSFHPSQSAIFAARTRLPMPSGDRAAAISASVTWDWPSVILTSLSMAASPKSFHMLNIPTGICLLDRDYAVVDPRSQHRGKTGDEIFVTLGSGFRSEDIDALVDALADQGCRVCATQGFDRNLPPSVNPAIRWIRTGDEIRGAVSTCLLAITNAGISLYEMLAAGVPTIALSVDELQLRDGDCF